MFQSKLDKEAWLRTKQLQAAEQKKQDEEEDRKRQEEQTRRLYEVPCLPLSSVCPFSSFFYTLETLSSTGESGRGRMRERMLGF